MRIIAFVLTIFGLISIPFFPVRANDESIDLPGFQYSCLQTTFCRLSNVCSLKHVHRVQLESAEGFKMVASSKDTYLTECVEVPNAVTGVPDTICTTGSSDLDKELFCGPGDPNPERCDFAKQLKDTVGLSLDYDATHGIFFPLDSAVMGAQSSQNNKSGSVLAANTMQFVKTPPKKLSTDGRGNLVPSIIEWQSYTPKSLVRKFLVWSKVKTDQGTLEATDPGLKQATLSFTAASANCQGYQWDPEGVAYNAETGLPIADASIAIQYSPTQAGPFVTAESGIDKVLPPGTDNPMITRSNGFYRFYGAEGYYTMATTHALFDHAVKSQTVIPQSVSRLYPDNLNYFADSDPVFEKAGTKQIRHIPMRIKPGGTTPIHEFQVLSKTINSTVTGDVEISATTNAPATAIIEICTDVSGVLNCRDKKEFAPGSGGPSPANGFLFETKRKQSELAIGEKFEVSFIEFSLTTPQAKTTFVDHIRTFVERLIPVVSAEEPKRIRLTVEPIPTYLEGYAYDAQGNVIPNATVGVFVSFSPRPIYQTTASADGFYRITSEHLPRDPYTIQYVNPAKNNEEIKLSTSQVLAQNQEFMLVEKIDPYKMVTEANNPRAKITPTFQPRDASQTQGTQQNPQANPPSDQSPTSNVQQPEVPGQSSTLILVAAILLIMLSIGGGVAVFVMMKKKREAEE